MRFPKTASVFLLGCALLRGEDQPLRAYRDFALRRDGDVERGRAIFFTEKTLCTSCHTVDGKGGRAGPDLFAVGDVHPRRDLIAAVLEPSASIAVGYDATLVTTRAGTSYLGVIKEANADETALMGADGKLVRLRTAEIKDRKPSDISLMPAGLQGSLTLQEFADLIEYLESLKQPANSLTSNRGMPATIPELAKPVTLRPLFSEALRFPSSFIQKPGDVRVGLTWFGQLPGSDDFLAGHQSGKIWRLAKGPDGFTKTLFGDFTGEIYSQRGPNGLLGVAFHPKFRENRKYYLKHQVFEEGRIATVLVEKRAAADFQHDSGEPSRRLLTIPTVTQDHTGGCITFGPDGMLYLGMGDTGPQQDPNGHGQNLSLLLGKMLRIDVDRQEPGRAYAIPPDNPFRDRADARPEIWAFGLREPWRFSFDSLTGDLWVGDVGQDRIEEVTIVRRGENHGWNVYEGFEPFSNQRRRAGETYVPPVVAYKRSFGNSVTGGFVYRADPASSFYGVYIFGDYTSHRIWGLTQQNRTLQTLRQIALAPESVVSFATDRQGRIYVVAYEGMVYEMDFSTADFGRVAEARVNPRPSTPPAASSR